MGWAQKRCKYGQNERNPHPLLGVNSRLAEMHAAMLAKRVKWLSVFTARRRQVAEAYREGIDILKVRQLATPEEVSVHVYHLYVIASEQRKALQSPLQGLGGHSLSPISYRFTCSNLV